MTVTVIGRAPQISRFTGRHHGLVTVLAVTALVTLAFGICTVPAHSASVQAVGSTVVYAGAPGEDNHVTVSLERHPGFFGRTEYVFSISDGVGIDDFDGNPSDVDSCFTLVGVAWCPASEGSLLRIHAGDGDDRVVVEDSVTWTVYICGEAGDDTLSGGAGGDRISAGPGSDLVMGNQGADLIAGTELGPPLLQCPSDKGLDSLGGDRLDGGADGDFLQGTSGPDILWGREGGDGLVGAGGDDSLDGGSGDDNLVAGAGDDSVQGGNGTDGLTGGPGSDSEFGGEGDDELGTSWLLFVPPVQTGDKPVLEMDVGDDTMDGGPGNDVINGGPGALLVTGFPTSLRNVMEGEEVGEANGSDSMHGGPGRDTVTYVKRATAVELSLDSEKNDGAPGELDRIGADVESVVGGSGDDMVTGSRSNDQLDGGKGSDTVDGGPGDDGLSGGRGDDGRDRVVGGEGNDTLAGLNGSDHLLGGTGEDVVAGGGGSDVLEGGEADDAMTGGPGADLLMGGGGDDGLQGADPAIPGADGPDDLRGEKGRDTLQGGDGNDLLAGGPGPDRLVGEGGADIADYSAAIGSVSISLDGRANDGEDGEGDNLASDIEGGRGGVGKDLLSGDSRDNELIGGPGEDFLEGGAGTDRLDGSEGNDAVDSRDSNADLVTCGPGFDIAIADTEDRVRDDCELVDRSRRATVALGRRLSVRLVRGSARVRPRSMDRFFPLRRQAELAVRSLVDARKGTVAVLAREERRRLRTTVLRGGVFMVDQQRSRSPLTDVRLRGVGLERCGASRREAVSRRARRMLWARASGRVRVLGRHGSAVGRRASWTTTDRCDGTLVRVHRGRVDVFDKSRGRTFRLTAGEAHLAKR